jgi:Tfp pilus assembly protein PilF
MKKTIAALLMTALICALPDAAKAQTLDQQRCADRNPDVSISGCTAVIQSGQQSPENLGVAFRDRGLAYYRKGQYDRAIQDCDDAIRLNPNDAWAFLMRGVDYAVTRHHDRAIQDFGRAIQIKPDNEIAFRHRGIEYLATNQPGRAIRDFDQAIQIKPDGVEAYRGRALVYGSMSQYDRAIQDWDRVISLKPDDADAFHMRGVAYDALGQRDRAASDLAKAGHLNPAPASSGRTEVSLVGSSGTFRVPVLINGVLQLRFTVDSGAADVSIPADVVATLMRTGTLRPEDFLGTQTYRLADGSTVPSKTFRIRSLKVGDKMIENVTGSMTNVQGSLLLGQSFLSRFRRVSFNYNRQVLELE